MQEAVPFDTGRDQEEALVGVEEFLAEGHLSALHLFLLPAPNRLLLVLVHTQPWLMLLLPGQVHLFLVYEQPR